MVFASVGWCVSFSTQKQGWCLCLSQALLMQHQHPSSLLSICRSWTLLIIVLLCRTVTFELTWQSSQHRARETFARPCLIMTVLCVSVCVEQLAQVSSQPAFRYQLQLSFAMSSGRWWGAVRCWALWRVKLLPPSGHCQLTPLEVRQHADGLFF